jgi:hypothetical protein
MSVINIRTVDSNNVIIEKEGKELGVIKLEGFFKRNITAILKNNAVYNFVRSGFWNDKYEFIQGNEVFISAKLLPFGKIKIGDVKAGKTYQLILKSFFKNSYDLINETGNLLFHIKINRGLFVTIRSAEIETTEEFDSIKEQFLICSTALLMIKKRIRRKAALAS